MDTTTQSATPTSFAANMLLDLFMLALTMWREARGEGEEGMLAVGWVVKNRALQSPKYHWSPFVSEVCTQPYQFSCFNKNDPNVTKWPVRGVGNEWDKAVRIAAGILEGRLKDPTEGCNHYLAKYLDSEQVAWAKGRVPAYVVRGHKFYKL